MSFGRKGHGMLPVFTGGLVQGISRMSKLGKSQRAKDAARAEDIARQMQAGIQSEAERLRGLSAPTPQEQTLRDTLLPLLTRRLGMTGEQLFTSQGPLAQQYAALVQRGMTEPGYLYPSVVGQQTQQALEEGLYPMLASRGINPQSPLAITEGRREARDIAIQNALNRLQFAQADINRGGALGEYTGGLEQVARGEAITPAEAIRQRQLGGAETAAGLASQGYLSRAGMLETALQRQSLARQNELQGYGQLAGTGIGAGLGFLAGGPPGAMLGAQLGSQALGRQGSSMGYGGYGGMSPNAYDIYLRGGNYGVPGYGGELPPRQRLRGSRDFGGYGGYA